MSYYNIINNSNNNNNYESSEDECYLYYMIKDSQQVCLHNVSNHQLGTTIVNKRTMSDKIVTQLTPFANDMADILIDKWPSLKYNLNVVNEYKRTQPTVDTAFQSIKKFYPTTESNNIEILRDEAFQLAAERLQQMLKNIKIKVIEKETFLDNIYDYLPEKSASAGLPYALHPGHKKLDVLENYSAYMKEEFNQLFAAAQNIKYNMSYRAFTSPCIVYQKSAVVPKTEEEKVRLIWGYPLSMTMIEGMFALPILEAFKKREDEVTNFFTAYTFGPYGSQHERYVLQSLPVVVRDFSSYDSTVPEPVIRVAFEIMFDMFQFDSEDQKMQYKNVYDMAVDYFIHTPILVGQTSTLFCKHHGIPSGSWFTSLIGSVANYLMTTAAHIATNQSYVSMKCMGDDNICQYHKLPNTKVMADYMVKTFGLKINEDKTYKGKIDGAKFLGRHFRMPYDAAARDLWWYRPASSTIIQMFFPHERENLHKLFIRLYSLYIDNPTWWMYHFLELFELQIAEAFEYQKFIDDKVAKNEWKYTHADIERRRMLRLITLLDDVKYDKLKPPNRLVFEIKSGQTANLF